MGAVGCANDPPSAIVGVDVAGCDPGIEHGSGAFVEVAGRQVVLTAAHTLRGARDITVTRGAERASAHIVGFDPEMDLAYLEVDGMRAPTPLPVDSTGVREGDTGRVYVVRSGEVVTLPVTITRRINIRTEDIYVDGETLRPGYELRVGIEGGDSGGPVVVGTDVIGVVWARSRRAGDRAYAIDPVRAGDRITHQLVTGHLDDVDLGRCS